MNEKTAIFSLASKLLSDIENSLQSTTYSVPTENKVRILFIALSLIFENKSLELEFTVGSKSPFFNLHI